jgi:deazaflavin-dependent oxidoreductase (nitroreductase family)
MTDWDEAKFEEELIADMRAHDGAVTAGPLMGHPLLIMTSTGAKSGEPRRAILTWSRDGSDFIVAASAGGSKRDPAWLHNVREHPDVTIETGNRTFEARASVSGPADRAKLWDQHVAALPHFAAYPEQTGRLIPVVRLTPVT